MAISEPAVVGASSEFPEEIIHHILSLLPLKDVARASCLSKAWLNAWRTRPILRFDEWLYNEYGQNSGRGGFLRYGNRALQKYREENIGIEKFQLVFDTPIVGEWIKVALDNGVKKLELVALRSFVMPGVVFHAKSPLELSIHGSGSLLKLPKGMKKCQNIKSLRLRSLYMNHSDLQKIISNCPMIEDLILRDFDVIGGFFKVTDLPKLKQSRIQNMEFSEQTVEVEVPNLEFLCCSNLVLSMRASQNLKQLHLFKVGINDEFFSYFKDGFPQLEELKIDRCMSLEKIRMSSVSLRKMELVHEDSWNTRLEELHIDAPNMTQFKVENMTLFLQVLQINAPNMTYFKYSGPLIGEVSFTCASSSHCCSYIDIYEPRLSHYGLRSNFLVKLKELLMNLSESKIHLYISFNLNPVKEEEMETPLPFVPVEVLEIRLYSLYGPNVTKEYLDELFWICQPKTIIIVFSSYEDSQNCSVLDDFISKCLVPTRHENDSSSPHIKFWERRVKKIQFQLHVEEYFCKHVLELEMET